MQTSPKRMKLLSRVQSPIFRVKDTISTLLSPTPIKEGLAYLSGAGLTGLVLVAGWQWRQPAIASPLLPESPVVESATISPEDYYVPTIENVENEILANPLLHQLGLVDELLKQQPTATPALALKVKILQRLGRIESAQEVIQTYKEVDPNSELIPALEKELGN